MGHRDKVLVFLLGSLGDSLVAIPALRVVRENFPNAEIVALHESGLGLVEPPDVLPPGLVDRYLSYKRGKYAGPSLARLLPDLRREKFDAAVYLVFSERPPRSVFRDRMFFQAAGIDRLIGFHGFQPTELYPVDTRGLAAKVPSEAERKVSRLTVDGLVYRNDPFALPWLGPTQPEIETAANWLRQHLGPGPVLAIAPGCKTKANQWPLENFVDLIKQVRGQVATGILIVGGPAEGEAGDLICRELEGCANAAGKFSVRETAALLGLCDGYVGLDTGTTHLAASVGIPVVAIYGQRNNPGHWFPHARDIEIIQHEVACAGCRAETCPLEGHPCLTRIDVAQVAPAVTEMLRKKARPSYALEAT
jgi:ADP-heptose:LPS heptosyltransferase